jgi:hypothetical protein
MVPTRSRCVASAAAISGENGAGLAPPGGALRPNLLRADARGTRDGVDGTLL